MVMKKENLYVMILPSSALSELKLEGLANHRGHVVEDLTASSRRVKGYLVMLDEAYLGENLWFIPEISVSGE